jgi:2,4-dienoyl-CoA reductase (NADPH2)
MARPLLADPDFVNKARAGQAEQINTCIACNQACLDHIFEGKEASCLVNPRACRETMLPVPRPDAGKAGRKIAVVGAGPAGLSCATELAAAGFEVHLFEAAAEIGGQFNLAKRVPGKVEFNETLRYFSHLLEKTGVRLHLQTRVAAERLLAEGFEQAVLATGVRPRMPDFEGARHPKVLSYIEVLSGRATPGKRVAVLGAGGIGFDVATYLTHPGDGAESLSDYLAEWGVDVAMERPGGLKTPRPAPAGREVWLLKRSKGKFGEGLGKTTGWAHRIALKNRRVQTWAEVQYEKVDDQGLHLRVKGAPVLLEVDHVVVCAGQESLNELEAPLRAAGMSVHTIGGARLAAELDAQRAIEEGLQVALTIIG